MNKILNIILAVVLVGGIVGLCVGWSVHFGRTDKKEKPPVAETLCEHEFQEGVCELCGKKESEVSWNLDIVTKDCSIKFFVGDEKKYESFGMGINGYTVDGLYDNVTVTVTSSLSDTTKVNIYKCEYTEDGEFTGYEKDAETTLFEDKKYNKVLVATLKVTAPVYEISSNKDCLYIFEKID